MKILECEQYSDEWYQVRIGMPTSSNFNKIITVTGRSSKQAQKYMYRLAGERIIEQPQETYQNDAMLRGLELEEEARQLYQVATGNKVKQVGFCHTEGKAKYGCSPDGFVKKTGMVEIKCPLLHTHIGYLLEGDLPIKYVQQIQGQLLVADRKWCDFVSYFPGIKPLIVRVKRNEKLIKMLKSELKSFCKELDEVVKKIGEKSNA